MDTARVSDIFRSKTKSRIVPAISAIADEGVQFKQSITTAPWTLPSHASLFTGTYPSKHGAHAGHKQLRPDLQTLAEIFTDVDYETVAVSNNTWISEEFGFARGFETFHKTWQYVQSDTDLGRIARIEEGTDMFRALAAELTQGNPLVNLANAFYGKFLRKQEDDGARQTNTWIRRWLESRDTAQPFFLFVNYLEPHLEYRPPRAHAEQFLPSEVSFEAAMDVSQDAWRYIAGKIELSATDFEILRALYRAEIAYLDERIGELNDALVAAGEWDDTVFVVTSDHGENIGEHGLMDHQYALYDTLVHVPLVISGGPLTDGETVDDQIQLVDVAPTLLDIAGIEAPEARQQFQGYSFHPEADSTTREFAIAEYMTPQPSMDALEGRVGSLSEEVRKYDRSLRTIRTDQYKYIRGSDGSTELFDIQADPRESNEISEGNQDTVAELDRKLDEWLDSFEHTEQDNDVGMNDDTKSRLEELGYLQ
jgi:arylsulfatase A-like enzyme